MARILGRCSNCNALIITPDAWFSVIPWVPTCGNCGATEKLPIIEMGPPSNIRQFTPDGVLTRIEFIGADSASNDKKVEGKK